MPNRLLKSLLRGLLGDYALYEIYALPLGALAPPDLSALQAQGYRFGPLDVATLQGSPHAEIRERAGYGGEDALGFGVFHAGELVALQWYWTGERYRLQRNFWPLAADEAKSVELFTLPEFRGRGLATALKAHSAYQLQTQGYRRILSRIWHSNHPSRRVSEKLGWQHLAQVAVIHPLGIRPWRLRLQRARRR